MASSYPAGYDAFTNPTASDSLASATVPHATQHANANDAIEAIQAELGLDPAGASATVRARLDTLDTTVAGKAASSHTHAQSDVTNLTTDLAAKAPLASPTFTGQVAVPLGTAAAPSIIPTGDTNTGIYSPGADQVGIATAGTARVVVDASGNVGIGTTAPGQPIDIRTGSFGLNVYRFTTSAGSGAGIDFRKSASASVGTNAAVAQGDLLGRVLNTGADGTSYVTSSEIRGEVDAAVSTGIVPGRLAFLNQTTGGVLTERMRIAQDGLITGTGTSLGAWTSYTPTLGGTGWAIGNGTAAGAYAQLGKVIHFRALITFGSTSTYGASATPTISLPITAKNSYVYALAGYLYDTSAAATYTPGVWLNATTSAQIRYNGTSGLQSTVTATAPFTWATGDQILLSGTYEAA